MISKKFAIDIDGSQISYWVGLDQFILNLNKYLSQNNLKNEDEVLPSLIRKISRAQDKFPGSYIQLFDNRYLLNARHLYLAIYFMQKAFRYSINISNKPNIELLLYLAARRQIKRALNAFGLNILELDGKLVSLCIVSSTNNLNKIKDHILSQIIHYPPEKININDLSLKKLKRVRNFYKINKKQVQVLFRSYNFNFKGLSNENNLAEYTHILNDLIAEKMAKLSLEKINVS
ncbi:MAG: KEOPS complex subunit Cgi121 [archaeon]